MNQSAEVLNGSRLMGTLHGLIEARRVCRMEIPNTKFSWITLILGIQSIKDSHFLLIDKVSGFEAALSQSRSQDLEIDFMEADGVPCHFKTRFAGFHPGAIWVELPTSINRMQKRRFYRVQARLGTEVHFVVQDREEKAKVKDYSMGGVAFIMEGHLDLHLEDKVKDVRLNVPHEQKTLIFQSPFSTVIRIEEAPAGKRICVLEFGEMSEATKERLWRHIFEEERVLLQKTKRPSR